MRTTLDIDDPILKELKLLKKKEKHSLGRLVNDLLARALREAQAHPSEPEPGPAWIAKPMGAQVDLEDKDVVYALMERGGGAPES